MARDDHGRHPRPGGGDQAEAGRGEGQGGDQGHRGPGEVRPEEHDDEESCGVINIVFFFCFQCDLYYASEMNYVM